jgi:hypothetical protein
MKLFIMISLIYFISESSWSANYGCNLTPRQALEIINNEVYRMHYMIANHESPILDVEDSMPQPMKVNYNYDFRTQKKDVSVHYETIVRPQKTGYPKLFNSFYVQMERARHLMYVCLNFNSILPEESHLSIYFIEVHGLDPEASNQEDDVFKSAANKLFQPGGILNWAKGSVANIAPLKMELAPLGYITKEIHDGIKQIPVVGDLFEIPEGAAMILQSGLGAYNQILTTGVSKIEVTRSTLSFFKDTDPDKTIINIPILVIDLKKIGIDPFEGFK